MYLLVPLAEAEVDESWSYDNTCNTPKSDLPKEHEFHTTTTSIQHPTKFENSKFGNEFSSDENSHPYWDFSGYFNKGTKSELQEYPNVTKVVVGFWQSNDKKKEDDKNTILKDKNIAVGINNKKDVWERDDDALYCRIAVKFSYDDVNGYYFHVSIRGHFKKGWNESGGFNGYVDPGPTSFSTPEEMAKGGWRTWMRVKLKGSLMDAHLNPHQPKETNLVLFQQDFPFSCIEQIGENLNVDAFNNQVAPIVATIADLSIGIIALSFGVLMLKKMTMQVGPAESREMKKNMRNLAVGAFILISFRVIVSFLFWIMTGSFPDSAMLPSVILIPGNSIVTLLSGVISFV